VEQVANLSEDIPEYLQDLRDNETFRDYDDRYDITTRLEEQARELPARLGDATGALQAVTVGVFSAIVQLVTVLTMTFFLLLDGRRLVAWGMGLVEPRRRERLQAVGAGIYRSVSGYVAGALTISTINGFLSYVVMTILGVPFAVPLAVLMAFLGLIPLIGATIGAVIIGVVTAFNDFPADTIVWVVYAVLYQQAENNILQPAVYRRAVNVHPLIVIIAILIGASLLGVLGALVAIPVAATVQIIVRDLWEHRRTPAEELLDLPPGVEDEPPPEPEPAAEPA
jgi:predicted PurR-regulated permease PerM